MQRGSKHRNESKLKISYSKKGQKYRPWSDETKKRWKARRWPEHYKNDLKSKKKADAADYVNG